MFCSVLFQLNIVLRFMLTYVAGVYFSFCILILYVICVYYHLFVDFQWMDIYLYSFFAIVTNFLIPLCLYMIMFFKMF